MKLLAVLVLVLGMHSAWAPELLCPGAFVAEHNVVYCMKFVQLKKVGML